MRLIKSALLALMLAAGACAGNPQPEPLPPTVRPIAIRTCVAGAQVTIDGALNENRPALTADANGDVVTDVFGVAFNLHARAANYPPYDVVVTFGDNAGHQLLLGPCHIDPSAERGFQLMLPEWRPLFVDTGERGRVRTEGQRFVRADGTTFPWRGTDGFLVYAKWLSGGAATIDPIIQNWLTCGGLCNARGPNVIRVLGMVTWGNLYPQQHPEYYDQLRPFVDHLWTTWHLRVEFVIFADSQVIMPDRGEAERHALHVLDQLAPAENVFIEVANEPFQNIPGGGIAAAEIGRLLRGRGIPIASGDYEQPWLTALDYLTVHTDRGPEWPRKAKDLLDYRNGDLGDPSPAPGWRSPGPVVGDEPIGFNEGGQRSSGRSTDANDAAYFGAACQLFSAGCTFHNDAGTDLWGPYGPLTAAAAAAFFQGLYFVPADAQFSEYQRGSADGGPGIGNMPIEHLDTTSLRTFCKAYGGSEYCVAIRPTADWRAIARDGWIVAEEPRRGLVRLTR